MLPMHSEDILGLKPYRWTYVLSAVEVSEDNSLSQISVLVQAAREFPQVFTDALSQTKDLLS